LIYEGSAAAVVLKISPGRAPYQEATVGNCVVPTVEMMVLQGAGNAVSCSRDVSQNPQRDWRCFSMPHGRPHPSARPVIAFEEPL